MSYDKTTWSTGDVVTADKLNNIENGIENASGVFMMGMTVTPSDRAAIVTMDKSYNEVKTAFNAGKSIKLQYSDDGGVSTTYFDVFVASMVDDIEGYGLVLMFFLNPDPLSNNFILLKFEGVDADDPLTVTVVEDTNID